MGQTYVEVSRWARRQLASKASKASKTSKANGLGMGIVESFSHVVWDPLASELQDAERETARLRRAGIDSDPSVLIVDDVSFDSAGFSCLVLADVSWADDKNGKRKATTKLRLVRVFATNNTEAWALAMSELGAPPQYVMADGSASIANALKVTFPHAEEDEVRQLPSIWHVKRALHETFWRRVSRTADRKEGWEGRGLDLPGPVARHLARLGSKDEALRSHDDFYKWWATLEGLYETWGVPQDVIVNMRNEHKLRLENALDDLVGNELLPLSTGAVEALIRDRVKPFFTNRAHSFGNLERTNRALNLLVATHRGALDDTNVIARAVREDLIANNGRAYGQRHNDDPYYPDSSGQVIRYSSLRDIALVGEIAKTKGLT